MTCARSCPDAEVVDPNAAGWGNYAIAAVYYALTCRRVRIPARNQLKSVFIKTDTHRQSQLVALLSQVG